MISKNDLNKIVEDHLSGEKLSSNFWKKIIKNNVEYVAEAMCYKVVETSKEKFKKTKYKKYSSWSKTKKGVKNFEEYGKNLESYIVISAKIKFFNLKNFLVKNMKKRLKNIIKVI